MNQFRIAARALLTSSAGTLAESKEYPRGGSVIGPVSRRHSSRLTTPINALARS
jgi:hypothetical protein